MEFIKHILRKIHAKKTGICCGTCAHQDMLGCCDQSKEEYMACWHSVTRPGWKAKKAAGDLTQEERHELEKIVSALCEAEETARDGGLLGSDFDDKPNSGLIEED